MKKLYRFLLILFFPIITFGSDINTKFTEHNYYETIYIEGCINYVQEKVSEISSTEVVLCLESWQCVEKNVSTNDLRKIELHTKGTDMFYTEVNEELVSEVCKEFFVDYWWEVFGE